LRLRWNKVWVVARKDLWEFRRNKFIIYTMLITPLIMAVLVPVGTFIPLKDVLVEANVGEEFDYAWVQTPITYVVIDSHNIYLYHDKASNMSFYQENAILRNVSLRSVTVHNCVIQNSTFDEAIIWDCVVSDSVIVNGMITNSFILNSTVWHGRISGSSGTNITTNDAYRTESDLYDVHLPAELDMVAFYRTLMDSMLILFVMLPAILPTVLASYSFIGEKQNKSLEPLLATPTSDMELLLGKSLSVFIPTMASTLVAFVLFAVLVDYFTFSFFNEIMIPDSRWIVAMVIISPLFCIMGIMVNVLISSKVSDVRASQQIGSLVVLPIVALFIMSSMQLFALSMGLLLILALLLVCLDAVVFFLSYKSFKREKILVEWR
jgi:ABC-type multidrug transport system permease subunit